MDEHRRDYRDASLPVNVDCTLSKKVAFFIVTIGIVSLEPEALPVSSVETTGGNITLVLLVLPSDVNAALLSDVEAEGSFSPDSIVLKSSATRICCIFLELVL